MVEKLTREFLVIKNVCYVKNFILNLIKDPNREVSSPIDSQLQQLNLEYSIRNRKKISPKNNYKLFNFNGKLSVAQNFRLKEGILVLIWKNRDISIEININFELVEDKAFSYDCNQFFEDIKELIQKYQKLNELDTDQSRLNHFLNPHISGVRNDFDRLYSPIRVSYELKGTNIQLKGISEKKLMENARNNQNNNNQTISISVIIENIDVELLWNDEKEFWVINGIENITIPVKGSLIIGKKKDIFREKNKNHNRNQLNRMLNCLKELKHNLNSPGNTILNTLLQDSNPSNFQIQTAYIDAKEIEKKILEFHFNNEYMKLDNLQKKCLNKVFKNLVLCINGEGGTGKTEVGALISIIYSLFGKKILISSVTNNAVDNILERIDKLLISSKSAKRKLNIVRFRSKNQRAVKENLKKYGLDYEIKCLQNEIEQKYSKISKNSDDFQIKNEFYKLFNRPETLERVISLAYDIILTTYGLLSARKYFYNNIQKFDLNIIEASSSVNFSIFSNGAHNSKKWLFLSDKNQLSPLTIGDFLLRQPLRFPNKDEIQNAVKYNSVSQDFKKSHTIWSTKEYKKSIASVITRFENNKNISVHNLKQQYRIHPKLFEKICYAFDEKFERKNVDLTKYIDLNNISPLFSPNNHLKYQIMKDEEILNQMGKQIAKLVEDLIKNSTKSNKTITIGVACTDVDSLRKVIKSYKIARYNDSLPPDQLNNYYNEELEEINVSFYSIINHQEREYDIFILGIMEITSKNFRKRIYTALTRASNYVIVFGPKSKKISRIPKNFTQSNNRILKLLEEN